MKKQIIVVADLQHFKAFEMLQDALARRSLQSIESHDNPDFHGKLSEKVTDRAGHLGNHESPGHSEQPTLEREHEKKAVKGIADAIEKVLTSHPCDQWYLALPRRIHNAVLERLNSGFQGNLKKSLPLDLTKSDQQDILTHFELVG
jgi:hypothetical protein